MSIKKSFGTWLVTGWYKDHFVAVWLIPFSMFYQDFVKFRRYLYRIGVMKSYKIDKPVIVVGNITVGGTGKTPFIIWLVEYLKQAGYKPGVISRGYQGKAEQWPQWVDKDSDPVMVGDEAILLTKYCACPVVVGPSRVVAARYLLQKSDCDIILSDDGLQHYALKRDLEILVIDGVRRFGNGAFLPGGPLREPISRILQVDLLVCNGGEPEENEHLMTLQGNLAQNMANSEQKPLIEFRRQQCHAVAGIGNPTRFFDMLKAAGLTCITHIFPDHYPFEAEDIDFKDQLPVLMTEKDAVKCTDFANARHWFVPVKAQLGDGFTQQLDVCLKKLNRDS